MSPPSALRAVVFDLDGLMFNTEDLYDVVAERLLARRGQCLTTALKRAMMGVPNPVALQMMIDAHQLPATVAELEQETEELFAELLATQLVPLPGLETLLAALEAATLPKAIATSSWRAYVRTVLGRFGLEPRFEFVLTSEDVVHGKPHPEIYQQAARRLDLPPSQVMVLEDSENGCRAAVAAGAFTVAVPSPHSHDHDFDGVAFIAAGLTDPRIYQALGLPLPSGTAENQLPRPGTAEA
jgi:HAD superfamily hydrolase (TIGR01509 family)